MSEWHEKAACRDMPLEWFFPREGGSYARGKRVCARCPVKDECLDFALSFPPIEDQGGLFGGLSPRAREDARRVHVSRRS